MTTPAPLMGFHFPFCWFFFVSSLISIKHTIARDAKKKKEKGNFSATVCRSYSIIHLADE